jgi:predicted Ser/Thr protein kinase
MTDHGPPGDGVGRDPSGLLAALREDQRRQWRAGRRVPAADYLRVHPALADDDEAAFELIYSEILVREELGEAFRPEEYLEAYPRFAPRLRLQLEVHRAMATRADIEDGGDTSEARYSGSPSLLDGRDGSGASTLVGRRASPSPPGATPQVPGYEVLRELGRGGMGVVFEARQVRLKRPCVLKMILAGDLAGPVTRARFLKEAEVVARFQHPNIVQVHAVGEHDGRPFFEQEYAEGGSLADRLDGTPQPPEEAARLVEMLAGAMDYAHRRGVVHRDLKPANVLLAADGTPKIGDFGLAKLQEGDDGATLTHTGAVLGTPSYMAPEQAAGDGAAVGPAADIYALGVILYELLIGRAPFRGTTPLETIEQVRTLDPAPPRSLRPKLPRDLEAICLKCLEKDPSRRYADAASLADDLRRFLRGDPILARPCGSLERLIRTLDRGRYDKEFGNWAPFVLYLFCPAVFLAHLCVFVLAWHRSPYLNAVLCLPLVVLLALLGIAIAIYRVRGRATGSPAVRLLTSIVLGQMSASLVISEVYRRLTAPTGTYHPLAFYPLCAATMGTMFFAFGGAYWGRLYVPGLACFALAPVMAMDLTWAPLEFAALVSTSFVAIGLHLRRLGRAAAADPAGLGDLGGIGRRRT